MLISTFQKNNADIRDMYLSRKMPLMMQEVLESDLVDSFWLVAGYVINLLVLCLSIQGTIVLIVASQSLDDLILNAVALFFVVAYASLSLSLSRPFAFVGPVWAR